MLGSIKNLVKSTGLRRQHVAAARMCCERHVLASVGKRRVQSSGRILCYHSVGQEAWGVNDVSARGFRQQLELALKAGLRFVPADEIVATGGGPKDLAITFDDGTKSTITQAAAILADYDIPWSVFVVTDWTDGGGGWPDQTIMDWRDVERAVAAGAQIGSHSVTHPNFAAISSVQAADELGISRRIISERVGIDAKTFAIPFGQSTNWSRVAAEAARQAGYTTIYAQAQATRPEGTIPRTFITRFDTERVFRAALDGVFDSWEEWV
jgi:peptidoglycan/xylan/chitin deacetylase (PgdA/CDA1 family)